ncbi:MAG: DUF1684 domain-containing protein [Chloroflexota bacterium]
MTTQAQDRESLTLLDWRRTVAAMYADVRSSSLAEAPTTLARFREARDRLFRDHPQSPLGPAARGTFTGLDYWPHDPDLRFEALVEPAPPSRISATGGDGVAYPLDRIGRVHLPVGSLDLYWIAVYGGGIFLPFRDATAGHETYGAGRYLLDTIKGADLGGTGDRLILDLNYAYHPSCAYDPRWSCPLAPAANWLDIEIRAGERLAGSDHVRRRATSLS